MRAIQNIVTTGESTPTSTLHAEGKGGGEMSGEELGWEFCHLKLTQTRSSVDGESLSPEVE